MKIKTLTNLKPLKKYIVKYKINFAIGFLLLIFSNLIQICEPVIINSGFNVLKQEHLWPGLLLRVFAYLNADTKYELLIFFGFFYLAVNLIRLPFIYFHQMLIMSASKRIECDLRNELFAHLQRLSSSFYHRQKTGDIMARFSDDIRCIDDFADAGIALINYLVLAPISIIYLWIIGKELVIYAMIPLIGVLISAYMFSKYGLKHRRIVQKHLGLLSTRVQENLSGIRVVKSHGNEENEINNYQEINKENLKKNMVLNKIFGLGTASVGFLVGLSKLIFLGLGCRLIISGKITTGNFAAFFYQLNQLTRPILFLGLSVGLFQQALARLERINEILLQEPEVEDSKATNKNIATIKGEIELKNLTFSLEAEKPILRNITMKLETGKKIALIGDIGSGKSTLLNLIVRLYRGPDKTIFIDNHSIEAIPLKVLRRNIGYVSQEPFLFSGSIRENICFGAPGATQETLDKIAAIADIKKDIDELPDGYETPVGEKGVTLSGGQKQRIAIARAIIIQPKILLLDNALSQLDADTEKKILQNLTQEMKDCTIIFTSNRTISIKNAELIVVLIKGQVVETGTHDQLLQVRSFYSAFFERELIAETLQTI